MKILDSPRNVRSLKIGEEGVEGGLNAVNFAISLYFEDLKTVIIIDKLLFHTERIIEIVFYISILKLHAA